MTSPKICFNLLCFVMVATIGVIPSTIMAQSKKQTLFDSLKSAAYVLYEEQRYEEAIVQFEKAYEVIPDPKIWFNLGQCHRQLNHVEQALLYYEKFLNALPEINDLSEEKKRSLEADVRKWVSQLRRQKEEEDARLREEEARRRQTEQQMATLSTENTPKSEEEKPTVVNRQPTVVHTHVSLTSRWWFWTGVGTTAVLAGTTVWAGLRAKDYNDQWRQVWDDAYRDKAEFYQKVTDILLVGTLVSAVATGVASWLFLSQQPSSRAIPPKSAFIVPSCDGITCMLQLTVLF